MDHHFHQEEPERLLAPEDVSPASTPSSSALSSPVDLGAALGEQAQGPQPEAQEQEQPREREQPQEQRASRWEQAKRVPTIHDLRVKLCYICREEERFDGEHPPSDDPPRAWTHPCSCTLVAHEQCLLHWIQSSQQSRARAANALKCPQCGARYELESRNPAALRVLNAGNRLLSVVGRTVTFASVSFAVGSVGFGLYVTGTAYGAYALREFIGKEMFDILLTEDPSNWPWHSFVNLPLIPLALLVSRLPFRPTIPPLVPVLLAWPTSAPVAVRAVAGGSGSSSSGFRLLRGTSTSAGANAALARASAWPPPPLVLGLFVYPLVREGYRRLYARVQAAVLNGGGTGAGAANGPLQRILLAINGDGPFEIQIEHGDGDGGEQQGNQPAGRNNNNNNRDAGAGDAGDAGAGAGGGGDADDPAAAAENTIRVSGTSLGRLVGGALIIPRIASFMGALLLRASHHSPLLRRILAVRPRGAGAALAAAAATTTAGGGRGLAGGSGSIAGLGLAGIDERAWVQMSTPKRLAVLGVMGLSTSWRGTDVWAGSDPVWWRNALGLGLFAVAKDAVHLLHLWLTKRELESRRVKNRSFAGVDVRELDLIDLPAAA
ncbi:hypothetical protein CONPUDRAFT_63425 [Coniophora puteana RWD-64-598 SS2]|uniref:RING-CH-type domain-containing protein n=1 Tax=Coniophora puteana (strain RWD-64-598) TaxID=741705 RepID=A0A5M3MC65_CONPW|nr:uncharacterized protein CONPUDRAFT_63425 [Coniophora puteana RWD-64-598 SS2]EIW76633.1 hypothetical protein CONPUDRAFT_63425 [Coniophora puteana RWD-64-598 SS2]